MDETSFRSVTPVTNATDVAGASVDRSVKPECAGAETQGRPLIWAGLVGTGLAAFCCATPVLAVLLPAVGLGAWLAGIDRVLLLLLFVSLGVFAFGLIRRQARASACCETKIINEDLTR